MIKGSIPALVTPFKDGKLDLATLKHLVDWQIAEGSRGLVPVGTTGVIRRAERNSEIVAEREVDVIMIPGELYARAWLRPLRVDELAARLYPPVAATG